MIEYAEELTRTGRNRPATIDGLRRQLSEREVVDLLYTVCVANMTNRINESLGVELEKR